MNFILKSGAAQPFFFLLAKFSKLAKNKFNMDKKMCFFGFLVTKCLHLIKKIARFLYSALACSQKCEGILNFG